MKKTLVIVVILLVVLGGLAALAYAFGSNRTEPPVTVQAAPAQVGDLVVTVTAPGEIEADTRVSISAKTSAQIVELPFEEGEVVTVGGDGEEASILVRLDDTDARARVRGATAGRSQAIAGLDVAKARIIASRANQRVNEALLDDATRDLERQQQLYENNDVSQKDVDAADTLVRRLTAQVETDKLNLAADEANLQALEAQIEAAEAEIERANEELTYTTIRSPINGTVTKVNAEVGEIVVTGTMNNAGTVIMEVADLDTMICTAEIDESSIADVEAGQKAIIRSPAYGDETIAGTVRSVALAKTVGTATSDSAGSTYYEVEILLDPEETKKVRVFSGLTADVEIETTRYENVLRIPSQAVVGRRIDELPLDMRDLPEIRQNKEFTPVVYRLVDGKTVVTPVTVGPSDLLNTVIESGLEPGAVILTGPFKVLETVRHDQPAQTEAEAEKLKGQSEK